MTLAYACILVAALLPIVCAGIAKSGMFGVPRSEGGYDNHDPRAWLARQTGFRARANAAQANSFEALPFFVGAVIVAHVTGGRQGLVDALAVAFIALRVAYIALYLADRDLGRSIVWMLGFASCIALLFTGAF
ncbi:MAG: MAPEG family protein [Rubrivivax sp.]|jgi:uncharacterized MAPEG superfamily protein|nr:MAPEG family protein [Rubrivivax sp.]